MDLFSLPAVRGETAGGDREMSKDDLRSSSAISERNGTGNGER